MNIINFVSLIALTMAFVTCNSCGISKNPMGKIIGGKTSKGGAWPWQIVIAYDGRVICGGTLVNTRWIVTAAHCIPKGVDKTKFIVRAGENYIGISENTEQDFYVSQVIVHPAFDRRYPFVDDIALLKLSWPARFTNYVSPACLPTQDVRPGTDCYLTGHGKTSHPGSTSRQLMQVKMKVVSNNVCNVVNRRNIGIQVTSSMICAGDNGVTNKMGCHGDSGGPLVCNVNGRWELHGAVSHGSATCDSKEAYTVFTRITQFRRFIDQYIRQV